MCRMKLKCYGKQAICILRSAQKKHWKSLNIIQTNSEDIHVSSVGAMMKLCIYSGVWQEEFKWALTYIPHLSEELK